MPFHPAPEERDALKHDFFSSLHCALPGRVVSFDPETRTAVIQPGFSSGGVALPLLYGVPVFMPVALDVSPGDGCLVVFADMDVDGFLSSGDIADPPSGRRHSLSDGFAFVGFRFPSGGDEA